MSKLEINKQKKRDALLNTAFELFVSKGIQKTSISDIVEHAGVAKGTFTFILPTNMIYETS